jgi:hypothetical protein
MWTFGYTWNLCSNVRIHVSLPILTQECCFVHLYLLLLREYDVHIISSW